MEERLFQPSERPMHVAVFGSGTGTILRAMCAAEKRERQPFAIRFLYTDRACAFHAIAKEERLPLIYNPFDPSISREEYDRKGLELLLECSRGARSPIDVLLLAGYMRLMSSVWLKAFPFRILNIHPADLAACDLNGSRKYIGDQAVYKALQAGESKTRTSVILIDEEVDGGPILVSGPWVPYQGGRPVTKEEAREHQERQKTLSDFPACLAALRLVGQGRVSLRWPKRVLFLDDQQMPVHGYEMEKELLCAESLGS